MGLFFRKTSLDSKAKSRGGKRSNALNKTKKGFKSGFKINSNSKKKSKSIYKSFESEDENDFEYMESNSNDCENDLNEPQNDPLKDLKDAEIQDCLFSNQIELPINRPEKPSPTEKSSNLALNDRVGDEMIQQLKEELAFIVDGKKRITDISKLASIDRQVDSLVAQLGRAGFDVEFTDASETEFIITKF